MNKKKIPKSSERICMDDLTCSRESLVQFQRPRLCSGAQRDSLKATRSTSTVCRRLDQHLSKWPFVP